MRFYKQFTKPKAISFDLDDTLYDNGPIMQKAEHEAQKFMAQKCDELVAWSIVDWERYRQQTAQMFPQIAQDMTVLRTFTMQRALLEKGFSQGVAAQIAKQGFEYFWFWRNHFTVAAQVVSLLEQLGQKYLLYIISNGNADYKKIGLGNVFAHALHPKFQQLRLKPHSDLFLQAEKISQIAGKNWLHIGDQINSDVNGALQVNWQAAWFNPAQTAPQESCLPHLEYAKLSEIVSFLL